MGVSYVQRNLNTSVFGFHLLQATFFFKLLYYCFFHALPTLNSSKGLFHEPAIKMMAWARREKKQMFSNGFFFLTGACAVEAETMDFSTSMPDEPSKWTSMGSDAKLTGLSISAHLLQKQVYNTMRIFSARGVHGSCSTSNQQCAAGTTDQAVQTVWKTAYLGFWDHV